MQDVGGFGPIVHGGRICGSRRRVGLVPPAASDNQGGEQGEEQSVEAHVERNLMQR